MEILGVNLNYQDTANKVAISKMNNFDEARLEAERKANERLEKTAKAAISINDYFTDNYFNISIYKSIINAFPDVLGGRLRQRACNTYQHINTHKDIRATDVKKPKDFRFTEWLDSIGKSTETNGLTPDQIISFSRFAFGGKDKTEIRRLYTTEPQKSDTNISICEAVINSEQYNALKDDNDNFKGFNFYSYTIPKEYQPFVDKFLENKKEISGREAIRLVNIFQALKTLTAYDNTEQQTNNSASLEDVDFFDLSGDGLLNRGDVSALELFLLSESDIEIKSALETSQKEDWNDLIYLKKISKLPNQKITKNIFDLNGDGNADEKDFSLYKNIEPDINNPNKLDINNDGYIDKTDVDLINCYFKAVLSMITNAKIFRENTEQIAGGKERLDILEKKINQDR